MAVINAEGDVHIVITSSRCSSPTLVKISSSILLSLATLLSFHSLSFSLSLSPSARPSNGNPCLTRYVAHAASHHTHFPSACFLVPLKRWYPVRELWATSDIIPALNLRQCRCVEELKRLIAALKGHETWGMSSICAHSCVFNKESVYMTFVAFV